MLKKVQRVLGSRWWWDSRTWSVCCSNKCSKDRAWSTQVERLEGKEISFPIHWSFDVGNNSLQGYVKANLGLHEEEIPKECNSKASTTSNSTRWVWNPAYEVGRVVSRTMAIAEFMDRGLQMLPSSRRSMLPKFNFVIYSIEESKDFDTLSLDELQNSLMVHEQKIVKQDTEEQALQAVEGKKLKQSWRRNSQKEWSAWSWSTTLIKWEAKVCK